MKKYIQKACESACVTGKGRRTCISDKLEKKICTKFWFSVVDFQPDPLRPFGDFENPLGQHAVPSGIFKIPSGLRGSGWKSPPKNQNFLYKFNKRQVVYYRTYLIFNQIQEHKTICRKITKIFYHFVLLRYTPIVQLIIKPIRELFLFFSKNQTLFTLGYNVPDFQ